MGVNKIVVEKWLEENGFSQWCICCHSNEVQYMDREGVNLWINWESGDFRFAWVIPKSVFKIVSGGMSPVWRLDHLDKMYTKFLMEVRAHGKQ